MKKSLIIFTMLGVFSCLENNAQVSASNPDDLKPSETQRQVMGFVTQILKMHHYQKFELDDAFSRKIWDNYLKELDGSKAYFTEADIKNFDFYREKMDEALLEGDPTPAFTVFNVYRQRYKERSQFIQTLLEKPFDFSVNESYETDREKKVWAKTSTDLDDFWRKSVKNQALELKLNGKSDSASLATLRERYKNQDKRMARLKGDQAFQIFMNAFTENIDPHTNYMIPSNAAAFNIDMSQSLEGIGATLRNEGDYVTIVDIVPGGPAARSKQVNKEDKVVGVAQGDGGTMQDVIGWDTNDAVKLIRGTKGTVVRLQLIPADAPAGSAPKEVRIVREKIKLEDQVAKKEILELEKDKKKVKIGLITLPMFYRDFEGSRGGNDFQSTTRDVRRFLEEFKMENVDGVIVDLRNNGGGSLIEAVNMTGLFISRGPVVQRRENDGRMSVENDTDADIVYTGPLAVMVNRFSASASEIFAAAIQDYKRGVIVGEQTFGKGTVQELADLDRMLRRPRVSTNEGNEEGKSKPQDDERYGQLKITTAKFYRITGSSTQLKGVTPDIELPSIYDAKEFGEESQATALPWDQVNSSSYSSTNHLTEKSLSKLREKYQQRLQSDTELKTLVEELAQADKAKDKTTISLQESERKKEREEAEKHRKTFSKLSGKDKKDIYLVETERILSDMVVFQK